MIVYIENPQKKHTKNNKVARYKINIQNQLNLHMLATSNRKLKFKKQSYLK